MTFPNKTINRRLQKTADIVAFALSTKLAEMTRQRLEGWWARSTQEDLKGLSSDGRSSFPSLEDIIS
jgi:hypothetical protein